MGVTRLCERHGSPDPWYFTYIPSWPPEQNHKDQMKTF